MATVTKELTTSKRAIGYVRVSTAGQEGQGSSLTTQRERLREYAQANGLELVEVVSEAASGGVHGAEELSISRRPRLRALIERAERGEYDVLLVTRFDRLSRDYATFIILERRLKAFGVEIQSSAETNGDSAQDKFFRTVTAAVAELERATILDRVRAGKTARRREGKHVGGLPPYGYRSVSAADGEGWTLEPVEPAAEIVRGIFAGAKEGDTPGRIADALNRDASPGPRGGVWNRTAVRGIVENVAYAGERYGVKGAHPAIVTRRLWNAANAALASRARR